MFKMLVIVVVVFVSALALELPAHACSCVEISPEQAFDMSDAVFEGVVVSAETRTVSMPGSDPRFAKVGRHRVRVVRSFKGVSGSEVIMLTQLWVGDGGGSCARSGFYPLGTRYLFFAHATRPSSPWAQLREKSYSEVVCARSGPSADRAETLDVLMPHGSDPRPSPDPRPSSSGSRRSGGCAGCSATSSSGAGRLALPLAALLVIACGRRRRSRHAS